MNKNTAQGRHPGLSGKQVTLLWLVLTLAIIPAMAFILVTEREVSQYHFLTFEGVAREALEGGNFEKVLRICAGALETGLKRGDYWGTAHLLRARAYFGLGKSSEAHQELKACVRLWTKAYYYATDQGRREVEEVGRELGLEFLAAGDPVTALRAFSAAGMGSGRPVEFLYELVESLDKGQKESLWPAEPYLIVEDFEDAGPTPFVPWVEEQGRELLANRIDPGVSRTKGDASALLHVSSATAEGRSWYAAPVYLSLSPKRYALRVLVKQEHPAEVAVVLFYWFDLAKKSAATIDATHQVFPDGWKRFDIERDFYAERLAWANAQGYTMLDGVILKLGLSMTPGPENRYWVGRVELYLPHSQPGFTPSTHTLPP